MGQSLASPNMKQLLLICAVVALAGCHAGNKKRAEEAKLAAKAKAIAEARAAAEANATVTPKPEPPKTEPKVEAKKPLTEEESAKIIEAAIRKAAKKPTGELTMADLEKVWGLDLAGRQLTNVKSLEKLTKLEVLYLFNNPDLTKAQIAQLKKALPKCYIVSNIPM